LLGHVQVVCNPGTEATEIQCVLWPASTTDSIIYGASPMVLWVIHRYHAICRINSIGFGRRQTPETKHAER
jgi:hypothetical protein